MKTAGRLSASAIAVAQATAGAALPMPLVPFTRPRCKFTHR